MSRTITIICGSPRKEGNTNRVVGWVAEAAREAGAEVEIIDAPRLKYKALGCTGCLGCQRSEEFRCVVDDEASPILARLPQRDAVVFASPVYWHGPTAQLKMFADRMFSLVKFPEDRPVTPFEGTTFGVIATGAGGMDDGLVMCEAQYKKAADALGFPFVSLLVPFAPPDPAQLESNTEVKAKAAAFGRKLAGVA